MINFFSNKDVFKKNYIDRVEKIYAISFEESNIYQKYMALGTLVSQHIASSWKETKQKTKGMRKAYYFSMEFLLGRMITNNIINLGLHEVINDSFNDLGLNLNEIEHMEADAGLGNGGLGRLAACFMDSVASLGLPVYGNCIRYRYGFFEQDIQNGEQVEIPDRWLKNNHVWEVRNDDEAVEIPFFGNIDFGYENGKVKIYHLNAEYIKAVPYDVSIVGANNNITTSLRLWSCEPSKVYPKNKTPFEYHRNIREISSMLYPDDITSEGKLLRLKQQYMFTSAGINSAINEYKRSYDNILDLDKYVVFHINDTHPALIIPELMRVLVDEESVAWEQAWEITRNICAYTNHTILSEALEKWSQDLFRSLLPRIYIIIEEINRIFIEDLINKGLSEQIHKMAILQHGMIKMANLAVIGSFSVNGVAELHTEILKNVEMKCFSDLYPNKFNNKTNGITHRRWCYHSNPELVKILAETIGNEWIKKPELLKGFLEYANDEKVKNDIFLMKQKRKEILAERIFNKQGIKIDINSIFDVQVKRLHEYKRQLLNALHIMYIYNQLKTNKEFKKNYHPHTFIFGAKAASSYVFAKRIIKLINSIADKVNSDLNTNKLLKVVFIINYNVSYAEIIMPSANVSEQISTAGKEASGTGNMKFMMNGAITIGTLDGANVEMEKLVGNENIIIFGMNNKQIKELRSYNPYDFYENDIRIKTVIDQLTNGFFDKVSNEEFKMISDSLLYKDEYYILKDFASYVSAQEIINNLYKNQKKWLEIAINNIGHSGFFSTDRTIEEYNKDIWKLNKII